MENQIASAYLSAMIDAEGSIINAKYNKCITIWNTEIELLKKCSNYLKTLNINHSIIKSKRICTHGNLCYVYIGGRNNLTKLYNFLKNFMCERKLFKLEILLKSYKIKSNK